MLEPEEKTQLVKELEEKFRLIFVTKDFCDNKNNGIEHHIQEMEITIAKMNAKLSVMIGISSAIGVSMLSIITKLLFMGG